MNTNDIENPRIRMFIREKLGFPRYGQDFDILVEEFFVRRQYVLALSPKEFVEDLENFSRSVKHFRWDYSDENWMGMQDPSRKSITFNRRFFNSFRTQEECIRFFETFCHECDHGTQTLKNGNNRAQEYNFKIGNRAHALYEICTQAIAAKIARNRTKSQYDNKDVLSGDGYSQEIFAVPLISSAFGTKEQDFLKYGVREREKLVEVLNKNIKSQKLTRDLLDRLEEQLEFIHTVYFPDPNQKEYANLSQESKLKIASSAMNNLINICEEVFATRIRNMPLEFDKSQIENLKYDYQKMNNTLMYEFQNYYGFFFDRNNQNRLFQRDRGDYTRYVAYSINCLSKLANSRNRGYVSETPNIITALKTGNYDYLQSFPFMRESNILEENHHEQSRIDEEHIWHDYNDFRQWDNSEIFRVISSNQIVMPMVRSNPLNPYRWDDVHTPEGNQKFEALKLAFRGNKKKYNVRTRQALFTLLDQKGEVFDESVYTYFTRDQISSINGMQYAGASPRSLIIENFNNPDDQIFLAGLMADRFINKLFDENGNMKRLENPKETEFQEILYQTINKYGIQTGNPESGRYQARFAIRNILLNDNYEGISGEENRMTLAMYGKKGVYDVVANPLMDELLCERRIIPEKRQALNYMIGITENRHPNSCHYRIARVLNGFKLSGTSDGLSREFSSQSRSWFDYYFRNQRDFEDMIGLICDEYSSQNYQNYTQDNINNPDIQQVLNDLGPDEFREAVIDVFFKGNTTRVTDMRDIDILKRDPFNLIDRLSQTYVRSANMVYANNNYLWNQDSSVPRVQLEDLSQIAQQEIDRPGINGRINNLHRRMRGFFVEGRISSSKNANKQMPDQDDDFTL